MLLSEDSPVMLQSVRVRPDSCWKAVGLPHSAGSVPDMLVNFSSRSVKLGKEPLLPQEAGRVPVRGVSLTCRYDRAGKAPGSPQVAGKLPVYRHADTSGVWGCHKWMQTLLLVIHIMSRHEQHVCD